MNLGDRRKLRGLLDADIDEILGWDLVSAPDRDVWSVAYGFLDLDCVRAETVEWMQGVLATSVEEPDLMGAAMWLLDRWPLLSGAAQATTLQHMRRRYSALRDPGAARAFVEVFTIDVETGRTILLEFLASEAGTEVARALATFGLGVVAAAEKSDAEVFLALHRLAEDASPAVREEAILALRKVRRDGAV